MKIEIDLPKFDEFRATGEYRKPLKNEWFLDSDHKMLLTLYDDPSSDDDYEFIYKREIPKPEPTLLERIEAAYLEYEVVMLTQGNMFLQFDYSDMSLRHINAQSMKGFAGYVYKDNIKDGARSTHVIKMAPDGSIIQPIAVLFEK